MVPPFVEFKNYIANLDVELPSIDSLFTKYDALKEGFTQEEKDSAYFLANDFMYLFEVEESEQEDYSEKAVKAMEKKYGKAGFVIGNNIFREKIEKRSIYRIIQLFGSREKSKRAINK